VNSFTEANQSKPKKERLFSMHARIPQTGSNGAVAILRYPDAIAHSPQIEHSGTAEKSGK
jgi:hypothetical protein